MTDPDKLGKADSSISRAPGGAADVPNLREDVIGGVTTFLAMAYIIVVNAAILATPGTGMAFTGVLTATVIICFSMTLLMGVYARLPFAVAPGMGINAFFSYTIILGQGVPWRTALGIIFWAGVFFLLLSVTPVRQAIAKAIPAGLRLALAAGIGTFLTFIGLKNAGIVASDPVTFLRPGDLDHRALLTLAGIALTVWLMRRKNPLAFLAGMTLATAAAWAAGIVKPPDSWVSMPDFHSVFLQLDIPGALRLSLLPAIIAILFTDLFDSISTFIGVSHATGMMDAEGNPKNLKQGLIVDAFATLGAGLAGTSSGTAYIESAAGINAGGRTGFASIVTALCFLPCFFLAPMAGFVPPYATASVLIVVGALMFRSVAEIPVAHIEDALPAFLTAVLIPLTFSITQGILWGFITHVGMYLLAGRRREIHPVMFALASIAVGLLALEHSAWRK